VGLGPDGCAGKVVKSKLLVLPQSGQENDDHNPDRVKPKNLFNLGIDSDNLLHWKNGTHITASVTIHNLTNKVALYNFLSTSCRPLVERVLCHRELSWHTWGWFSSSRLRSAL
jgi:hypothetical protein